MNKDYESLFAERKWKDAFDAMPLNVPKVVEPSEHKDLVIIRSRAYDFSKENPKKRVSVSLDYNNKRAIVTVTKK